MSRKVALMDYGAGNLLNVRHALEHLGADVELVNRPEQICAAKRLVLPGVGAFAKAIQQLEQRQMVTPLQEFAASGRPFLGICLGMQLMLDESDEFGTTAGLGIISGRVEAIPPTSTDGEPLNVPHVGWSAIYPSTDATWSGTPLETTSPGEDFYFVHSLVARPQQRSAIVAECCYGGHRLTAAIASGNCFGCQFHPEKSAAAGLKIIEHFLQMERTE